MDVMDFLFRCYRERQKTTRHKESCKRDVGMVHDWESKSKISALSGGLMLLIVVFKDYITRTFGIK